MGVTNDIPKMAAVSCTMCRVFALAIPRCSSCGGSSFSKMKHRLFSNYETEEKSTHFGYKRVSEQEKTEKGRHCALVHGSCLLFYFILNFSSSSFCFVQLKLPSMTFGLQLADQINIHLTNRRQDERAKRMQLPHPTPPPSHNPTVAMSGNF